MVNSFSSLAFDPTGIIASDNALTGDMAQAAAQIEAARLSAMGGISQQLIGGAYSAYSVAEQIKAQNAQLAAQMQAQIMLAQMEQQYQGTALAAQIAQARERLAMEAWQTQQQLQEMQAQFKAQYGLDVANFNLQKSQFEAQQFAEPGDWVKQAFYLRGGEGPQGGPLFTPDVPGAQIGYNPAAVQPFQVPSGGLPDQQGTEQSQQWSAIGPWTALQGYQVGQQPNPAALYFSRTQDPNLQNMYGLLPGAADGFESFEGPGAGAPLAPGQRRQRPDGSWEVWTGSAWIPMDTPPSGMGTAGFSAQGDRPPGASIPGIGAGPQAAARASIVPSPGATQAPTSVSAVGAQNAEIGRAPGAPGMLPARSVPAGPIPAGGPPMPPGALPLTSGVIKVVDPDGTVHYLTQGQTPGTWIPVPNLSPSLTQPSAAPTAAPPPAPPSAMPAWDAWLATLNPDQQSVWAYSHGQRQDLQGVNPANLSGVWAGWYNQANNLPPPPGAVPPPPATAQNPLTERYPGPMGNQPTKIVVGEHGPEVIEYQPGMSVRPLTPPPAGPPPMYQVAPANPRAASLLGRSRLLPQRFTFGAPDGIGMNETFDSGGRMMGAPSVAPASMPPDPATAPIAPVGLASPPVQGNSMSAAQVAALLQSLGLSGSAGGASPTPANVPAGVNTTMPLNPVSIGRPGTQPSVTQPQVPLGYDPATLASMPWMQSLLGAANTTAFGAYGGPLSISQMPGAGPGMQGFPTVPPPHQIPLQQWMNFTPQEQQMAMGYYRALGFLPADVMTLMQRAMPGTVSNTTTAWNI